MHPNPAVDFSGISGDYSTAIEAGSYADAQRVVQAALTSGATGAQIFARVLTPAMHRIGVLWERAEITAADEHLATAITNRVIGSVYEALSVEMPTSMERVLIAAVEGDEHVMGLRMIADVLEGAGYEVMYLGAGISLAGLLESIAKHKPMVVALGATAPWSASKLAETLLAIRVADRDLPIVLGGAQAERGAATAADDRIYVVSDVESVVGVVAAAVSSRQERQSTD